MPGAKNSKAATEEPTRSAAFFSPYVLLSSDFYTVLRKFVAKNLTSF